MKTKVCTYTFLLTLSLLVTDRSGVYAQLRSGIIDISNDILQADPSLAGISQLEDIEPVAINDLGWIVGHYPTPGGENQLFVRIPEEDSLYTALGEARVMLVTSGVGLTAAGISNNRTIIYNVTDPVTANVTGLYRLFNEATGRYEAGVGAEHFQFKDISGSWVAADVYIGRQGVTLPPNEFCPFFADLGASFSPRNLVRAMVFNIEGGGPGAALSIAFQEAELCNLSSRAYAVKASASGDLRYVVGESFGRGRGDERFASARAMVYSQEVGNAFRVTEMLGGTPGQIRAVNTIGEIAGTWFTPVNSQVPNSQRGFKTAIGCLDPQGDQLPFSDIYPDRSVLPNGINDDGLTVGNYLYGDPPQLRTFLFEALTCYDTSPRPVGDNGRVDTLDLALTFKDLTHLARQRVGINGWQRLSTAKDINNHNQIIGRGIGPDGNIRAYLFGFNPCELAGVRGLYPKGNLDPVNPSSMAFYQGLHDRLSTIWQDPGYFTGPKDYEPLIGIFPDNDALEGEGTEQGWYVNETAAYGPGGTATLLTNISPVYANQANHVIETNFFPVLTESIYKEAYLSFKVWSHQEKGIYDHVKIEVKDIGENKWSPLAYISGSYDPSADYSNLNDVFSNDPGVGWANYFIDLSLYINREVQLRFSFVSDVCVAGDGVLFKDFGLFGISEAIQHAEFARFLGEGTTANLVEEVPSAVRESIEVGLGGTIVVGGGVATAGLINTAVGTGTAPAIGLAPGVGIVVAIVATGVIVYYAYKSLSGPQPASSIIFSASPTALAADPNLGIYLDHKKQVFFDGFWMTDQMSKEPVERTLIYGTIINGLESVRSTAIGANEDDPVYLPSFTDVNTKEITLVFPTETDLILDQNNVRFWLKRLFSEMALFTDELQIVPYVHNTYTGEYIKITTPTEIGAETDFFYAYGMAQAALDVADNIWSGAQAAPREDENTIPTTDITIPTAGDIVLDDTCNEDPSENIKDKGDNTPETEAEPKLPGPGGRVEVRLKTQRNACGGYAIWLGAAGYFTFSTLTKHTPNSPCYAIVPYNASAIKAGNSVQPLNTINTWVLPFAGAVSFQLGTKTTSQSDLIESPGNFQHLDGSPFEIKLKEGFEPVRAFYEKGFANGFDDMEKIGLKPRKKEITITDLDNVRIDHVTFSKGDLSLSNGAPFKQVPANGRYQVRVCAKDAEQNHFESDIKVDLISYRLSRIDRFTGNQRVVFDVTELNPFKNAAIFVPGAAARGFIHQGGSGEISTDRIYEHEDLVFRNRTITGGTERHTFFDRWKSFETYIYHSLGYMETVSLGDEVYDIIARRILDPPPGGNLFFFDEAIGMNKSEDITPSVPLWQADKEYFRQVLDFYAVVAGNTPPGEDYDLKCTVQRQSNKGKKTVAIYAENVGILRILPAIRELLDEDIGSRYSKLRIILGFLDPVWPDSRPGLGDVSLWLKDHIDTLSKRPNVTVFTAQSGSPSLRSRIYGSDGNEVLNLTARYDLSFLGDLGLLNQESNPHILLKYMYALGAAGDLDIAYCGNDVTNPATGQLGSYLGMPCWSTRHPDLESVPYVGYVGPGCGDMRNYFRDPMGFPSQSYEFKALDFTGVSVADIFRLMEEEERNRLSKIALKVENLRSADQQALKTIITGEQPQK